MLREDAEYFAECRARLTEDPPSPYSPTKCAQALVFDRMGMPYSVDPDVGPIVGGVGGVHPGKWTFDEHGEVTLNPKFAQAPVAD